MAYTRGGTGVYVHMSIDDTGAWKTHMENHNPGGLQRFSIAREHIKAKHRNLVDIVSGELAAAFKHGDPFPSHFTWSGERYQMNMPAVLETATQRGFCNRIIKLFLACCMCSVGAV